MKSVSEQDWENTILSASASVRDALQVLEGGPGPLVLVVGASGELVGTVSDGDVRRGLLRGGLLDDALFTIMNGSPRKVSTAQSLDGLGDVLTRLMIRAIPIVDEKGRPVGLVTGKRFDEVNHEFDALVLAGGRGLRLRPITQQTPKPLVTISGRALVDIQIERLLNSGARRVYLATNYLSKKIEDHVSSVYGDDDLVRCLVEESPRGTAGAMALLPRDSLANIVVTNVDVIHDIDLARMMEVHVRNQNAATLAVTEQFVQVPFGVVQYSDGRLRSIVEKPEVPFKVSAGVIVASEQFRRTIVDERIDMPNALERARVEGLAIGILETRGYWRDVGAHQDLDAVREDLRIEID